MKKKICILTHTNLQKDPRPRRQIDLLADTYELTVIGTSPHNRMVRFFKLKRVPFLLNALRILLYLPFRFYERYYWDNHKRKLVTQIKDLEFDLIIVHEIRTLPLALKMGFSDKIILDAHEYSPENFADNFIWRLFIQKYYIYLCRKYISNCSCIITVSQGIADLYSKVFGVSTHVITSASDYSNHKPMPVDNKHIKIIHHGGCSSSRKIELLIKAAQLFNKNTHLYLMLVVTKSSAIYFRKLQKLAKNSPNVHFLSPVKSEKLVPFCNQFDVSVIFVPPVNTNLKFGLGNKFFEAIQSRNMLLIGPSIEMKKFVEKYELGLITQDFSYESLADAVNNLSEHKIMYYKNQCDKHAEELSSKTENHKLISLIRSTINE